MSVPEGKRGENKFEVFLATRDLAAYTLRITSNTHTFSTENGGAFAGEIAKTATEIYMHAWHANNIVVDKSAENWKRRETHQKEAAELCNEMLACVQLAYSVYHLSAKRIEYWTKKILSTRNLIRAWHENDRKRYGNLTE